MLSLLFVPEINVRTTVVTGIGTVIFLFITERVRNKRKWADKYLRKTFFQEHPEEASLLFQDEREPLTDGQR
jgi:hypothetical protein